MTRSDHGSWKHVGQARAAQARPSRGKNRVSWMSAPLMAPALERVDGGRPGRAPRPAVPRSAPDRLLRLFPSTTPLHSSLRPFFSYSEGPRGVAEGKGRSRRGPAGRAPRRRGGAPLGVAAISAGRLPRWAVSAHRTGGARSRWDAWDSWDGPRRGRVQICHKGVPRPDRPREEARNINDSLPALRLDRGLCGRFGQLAPSRTPGEAQPDQFVPPRPHPSTPPRSPTGPAPHRTIRPRLRPGWRSGRVHDTLITNV